MVFDSFIYSSKFKSKGSEFYFIFYFFSFLQIVNIKENKVRDSNLLDVARMVQFLQVSEICVCLVYKISTVINFVSNKSLNFQFCV